MKKLISIFFVTLLTITIAYSQSQANKPDVSQKANTIQYSKVDFFQDPNKLIYWNGSLVSPSVGSVPNIPLMEYNDLRIGLCRIICYPIDPKDRIPLNQPFDGSARYIEIKKIPMDQQLQKKYRIYGIFINPKNLQHVADSNNPNYQEPVFPCPASIYEKKNDKWILLKDTTVKDSESYLALLYDTGIGKFSL